jgi:hypothetical protein
MRPLMESCRSALERAELSIGVLGRFKAGKSSSLKQLIGRELLPVGVIPVTAVVTDLSGGETDSAEVQFRDGTHLRIRVNEIRQYVSETCLRLCFLSDSNPPDRQIGSRFRFG